MMSFPVTYLLGVMDNEGKFYLFERKDALPIPPVAGLLLQDIPDIPDVIGPHADFDNCIKRVTIAEQANRDHEVLVHLQELWAPSETIDEIIERLPGWRQSDRGYADRDVTKTAPPTD